MKKLFLIDGNSFCYRAYYAIRSLSTSGGEPTNAVYGFVVMLKRLIEEERPDYLAVSFDLKGPTFRHKKYADYKVTRKPMPDDLVNQLPLIKEALRAYNIPIFEKQGFEADDVIATLAKHLSRQGIEVYIATGDKDILQLVDKHIKVYSPHKERFIYDTDKVKERYGVEPKMIPEVMALAGDTSDNIPGVPGIGEKRAVDLIRKFGSLENILSNIDKIESKAIREKIEEFSEQAKMSKELATVDANVPLKIDIRHLKMCEPDREKLYWLFKRLEFNRLLNEVSEGVKPDTKKSLALYLLGSSEVKTDDKSLEAALKKKGLFTLYNDVELPLSEILNHMSETGVKVDTVYLAGLSDSCGKKLDKLTKDIYEMAGGEFNINSPKQLSQILFEKIKLPVVKRTKTGFSTDSEVLEKLSAKHALPAAILAYRELAKLKSTYIDALPKLVNPKTGRVHTSFNQTATVTGRLSSSQPNLQNIPIKTEEGRKIRRAFVARDKDYLLLSADYSQIELRVLAHFSEDETLKEAFKKGHDIHAYTASLVYNVPEKDVTSEMRDVAKTVNFGIIYGMSPYGLSKDLHIPQEEAEGFIDAYFQRYPRVKLYMEAKIKEARERGYVTTLLRRRRYLPEIESTNPARRGFAERAACNTPIQGSAADLIKLAMINIFRELEKRKLSTKMILQVHDELVFEVPYNELDEVRKMVKENMEQVVSLSVPIEVSLKAGRNWLDME